jgi:hypothetical protein
VIHISGTSTLVVGKGQFEKLSSSSKTNNGVGSAYGDGSNITMSPYQSPIYDGDFIDSSSFKEKIKEEAPIYPTPYSYPPYHPIQAYNPHQPHDPYQTIHSLPPFQPHQPNRQFQPNPEDEPHAELGEGYFNPFQYVYEE